MIDKLSVLTYSSQLSTITFIAGLRRLMLPKGASEMLKPYLNQEKQHGASQAILRMVRTRFKLTEDDLHPFRKRLQKLDLTDLEQLSEIVILADNLTDFEAKLKTLETHMVGL